MSVAEVVAHIANVWQHLIDWLTLMLLRGGLLPYFHIAGFLYFVGKYIIAPIFGFAAGSFIGNLASDRVSKRLDHYDKSMRGASNPQKRLPGGKK